MAGGNKVVAIYAQKLVRSGHIVKLVSPPPRSTSFRTKIGSLLTGNGWPVDAKCHPSPLDGAGLDHTMLDRWRPVVDGDVPDADVVVATWWETAEWVSRLGPMKGAKVYFIQHHEVFPYLPIARSQATYRLPFHKIVVAKWLKDLMESEYQDFTVDLVPNSVDHAQFFAPVRGKQAFPTVGFLYSTAAFKGLDVLLPALALVRERVSGLRLVAFGGEMPTASLVLPEGTDFSYYPQQDQIRNIYARCDVWATASKSEGFNLPAMEAMACRTPVVSTRTGWPEEAVKSGWNGVLVDVDDVSALAGALEWVLAQTDEAWRTLSSNAFETVAESSWDVSATMFEKALVNAQARASRGEIAGGSFSNI
jgi:glycosyltransferase involved in cell wall biosynthesis